MTDDCSCPQVGLLIIGLFIGFGFAFGVVAVHELVPAAPVFQTPLGYQHELVAASGLSLLAAVYVFVDIRRTQRNLSEYDIGGESP